MSHLFLFAVFLFSQPLLSQVKWSGAAGNEQWNDPLNWNTHSVPSTNDEVVLDNSLAGESYIVVLPADPVSVKSIIIDPGISRNIELILPQENIFVPGLTISAQGYGLTINSRGIFRNSSGASSGTPLMVSDSIKINNGGKFIINTPRAHAANVDRLSQSPGTENGIVEFDIPDASTTISLSGRTYGKLVLKASSLGRSLNYTAAGTTKVIIRSDLEIGDSVNFNLNFSDSILIGGDLIQGAATFNLGNTSRSVVVGIEGNISVAEEGTIMETGEAVQHLLLNGREEQQLTIKGKILNHVALIKNGPANARLFWSLSLPHSLRLDKGNIITTAGQLLILQSACTVHADSLSDQSFIDGPVTKAIINDGDFLFPVGKNGKMRWVQLLAATGEITVEYFATNPRLISKDKGAGIAHISGLEYWRVSGADAAAIKLSFNDPNSGGVTSLADLRVVCLQNRIWQNAGGADYRGSPGANGWVISNAGGEFLAENELFTLASATAGQNPLPLRFIQFTIASMSDDTKFTWSVDKDHTATSFELQESADNINYRTIYTCEANENLGYYSYQARMPKFIKKYYRVLAINKDQSEQYFSRVIIVHENQPIVLMNTINVNSVLHLKIMMSVSRRVEFAIYNASGLMQKKIQMDIQQGSSDIQIRVADLPAGNYICSVLSEQQRLASFKFIKR